MILFNISGAMEWLLQYKNIQNEAKFWLIGKLTTVPTKENGKYMHGQLKRW